MLRSYIAYGGSTRLHTKVKTLYEDQAVAACRIRAAMPRRRSRVHGRSASKNVLLVASWLRR
eukprot:scaffold116410_cov35-Tisochrysis_lutea.AAC.4